MAMIHFKLKMMSNEPRVSQGTHSSYSYLIRNNKQTNEHKMDKMDFMVNNSEVQCAAPTTRGHFMSRYSFCALHSKIQIGCLSAIALAKYANKKNKRSRGGDLSVNKKNKSIHKQVKCLRRRHIMTGKTFADGCCVCWLFYLLHIDVAIHNQWGRWLLAAMMV